MKIIVFVLEIGKIEKIIFSLVFVVSVSRNIIFSELSENVRKQHLFANAYSCVNIKFSYAKAVRKDEIFFVVLLRKQAVFHLRLGQLFVDDI